MGDDRPKSIKGSSIVRIKTHDGIVRLPQRWYVHELRKNLISLGLLARHGLK